MGTAAISDREWLVVLDWSLANSAGNVTLTGLFLPLGHGSAPSGLTGTAELHGQRHRAMPQPLAATSGASGSGPTP